MGPMAQAARDAYLGSPRQGSEVWEEVAQAVLLTSLSAPAPVDPQTDREGALERAAILLEQAGEVILASLVRKHRVGEPIFPLLGRDILAPVGLQAWINAADQTGVPEGKVESARDVLEAMYRYPGPRQHPY